MALGGEGGDAQPEPLAASKRGACSLWAARLKPRITYFDRVAPAR